MKTGIITFHFVNNYGGALQACALRRYIADRFDQDVGLIDYRHWFIRATDAIRMLPLTANVRYYGPWLRSFGRMLARRRKFAAFIRREGHLSRRVVVPAGLKRLRDDYRLLICGSDQIWNPMLTFGLCGAYFLRFAAENCRRISYAASVGGSVRDRKKMLAYIRDLDAVSIREKVDWLEKEIPVEHHIDPTLLLREDEWQKLAVKPEGREKYILCYFMQKNETAYSTIGSMKESAGCKAYDISRYGYRPECIDRCLVDVGPEEFVGLFSGAQHVCTNSFHGLVFALIFNKSVDFFPINRFGGRIEYLCNLLELKKVPVNGGAYYHIEYDPARKREILEAQRERAHAYLKREIEAAYDQDRR